MGLCGNGMFADVSAVRVAIGVRVDVFFVAGDEEVGACNDVGMADDCVIDFFD